MFKGIINKRGVRLESRGVVGVCLIGKEKGRLEWGLGRLGVYRGCFYIFVVIRSDVYRKRYRVLF